eukprot:scaffold223402_cov28-Tisochrysis_lutea.AAC.5
MACSRVRPRLVCGPHAFAVRNAASPVRGCGQASHHRKGVGHVRQDRIVVIGRPAGRGAPAHCVIRTHGTGTERGSS